MKNYKNKRRTFLKNIGLTALGLNTMPSAIFNLNTWAAAAADNSAINSDCSGYKALVCFYMHGGNDGFNMLVPKENTPYLEYQASRGTTMALTQNELLTINPVNTSGNAYGLNPEMAGIQQLFNQGKLSFIANVGTKLVPTTSITSYQSGQDLPMSLFSHIDQMKQWQTAIVDDRTSLGWAGRIADLLESENCNAHNGNVSMNISLTGNTPFLSGANTSNFALSHYGARLHSFYHHNNPPWTVFGQRTIALDSIYNHDYQDPFYNNFNQINKNGIDGNLEYKAALDAFEANGGLNTSFSTFDSGYHFSANLKMIAKSIAVGSSLGFSRQIFFVQVGGFDNHAELIGHHNERMHQVSRGLVEFNAALEELNMQDNVVTFSMSDFGRTLTANGSNGSDHGWGSNAIVMGGPVIGQSIFGSYPSLALQNNDLNVGQGAFIPTTSTDEYFAELAHWFGVSKSDLNTIFPNLWRFYDTTSTSLPMDFLTV